MWIRIQYAAKPSTRHIAGLVGATWTEWTEVADSGPRDGFFWYSTPDGVEHFLPAHAVERVLRTFGEPPAESQA